MTMKKTVPRNELQIISMLAVLTLGACDNGDNLEAHSSEDFSGFGGHAGDAYFDNVAISSRDALAGCLLEFTEYRITDSTAIDTTPTLGGHDHFNLVVYTSQEIGPTGIMPGVIRVQFLAADGAPTDPLLTISDGFSNDRLNDVFGDRVVFTAYESTTSQDGHIKLHDLSTGMTTKLFETATLVRQARIHDDVVVWVQGATNEAEIYYYDLRWDGTGRGPQAIAGGSPAALNVEIGENFIVWNTFQGVGGTSDVMAIDRLDPALADPAGMPVQIPVSTRTDADEQNPSTSGNWIVWETRPEGSSSRSTHAFNPVTGDRRVIQDVGTSRNASIDGDLVSYESNVGESGAFDIYLYRLSDSETFQVTNDTNDQLLNNIHGTHVAYVDNRTSFADVFVTAFNAPCPDMDMDIDIKPGSDENAVNPRSKGVIPVAVLSSMDFDATQVDFSTVGFGPNAASPVHDGHVEDVNNDGFSDMLFHFNTQDTGIACGDTEATLSGETFGGDAFTGTDSVKTVGCQ